MADDDEIVPEGISDFLPHESHGDLSFDIDAAHSAQRERTDQLIAEKEGRVVRTSIGIVGEALYPPLHIVEIPPSTTHYYSVRPVNLRFFIIPDAFNETFKSRWSVEDLSHGRINPVHNYGGTQREVSLTFTLAAFTVAESKSNLSVCQDLARTVYGRYRSMPLTGEGRTAAVFSGRREFTIDFGGLIRDERAFINKFAFTVDMDAGVFDYSSGEDTDVTHATPGVILPRALKIDIGFTIVHNVLLGFGGVLRQGSPLRWAENRNRDWPHGTGKIDVQRYMSANEVNNYNPPLVYVNDDHHLSVEQMEARNNLKTSEELQATRLQAEMEAAYLEVFGSLPDSAPESPEDPHQGEAF
tara:strand:+ start:2766 stop:3833 length:1068 start_codon:yes stop_codon:yes gene_type:complete